MNVYKIPQTDLKVSRIAYGCMGIGGRLNSEPMTADERKAAIDVVAAESNPSSVRPNRSEWPPVAWPTTSSSVAKSGISFSRPRVEHRYHE